MVQCRGVYAVVTRYGNDCRCRRWHCEYINDISRMLYKLTPKVSGGGAHGDASSVMMSAVTAMASGVASSNITAALVMARYLAVPSKPALCADS